MRLTPARQAAIVAAVVSGGKTYREVASEYGVSYQRVGQLVAAHRKVTGETGRKRPPKRVPDGARKRRLLLTDAEYRAVLELVRELRSV